MTSIRPLKAECKRGHPLSGDNLHSRQDGKRLCKACARVARALRREQQGTGGDPQPAEQRPPVPVSVIEELVNLRQSSRKDELAALAQQAIHDYDVTVYELSRSMGLSAPALRSFLVRRGVDYTRRVRSSARSKKDECVNGHDLTGTDSRTSLGQCRECRRAQNRERKARIRADKKAGSPRG